MVIHPRQTKDLTDIADFLTYFRTISSEVLNDVKFTHTQQSREWFRRMLRYNVPKGKRERGVLTVTTFKALSPHPKQEDVLKAYVLGWCQEMTQAACLMADDIMDNSKTRRGNPCWYLVKGVESLALNDPTFLMKAAFFLLNKHFRGEEYFVPLINFTMDIYRKTVYGQNLDVVTASQRNFRAYNQKLYTAIVTYKTGYYTIYAPIKAAMIMAGKCKGPDGGDSELLERICLDLGHYFQAQDDYLDVFGDPETTGKIGTDIEDGKCTWLFVSAIEDKDCTEEQREFLVNNYGQKGSKAQAIKSLFTSLNLPQKFAAYANNMNNRLNEDIDKLEDEGLRRVVRGMLNKLYDRNK